MNKQANADNPDLSLGTQFRQAREALNLTLDDVSKVIQLRPSILQQIEQDEWIQPHIAPIFMRGYVQSYARFLKLPTTLWQSFNFGVTQKNDLNRGVRAKIANNPHFAYGRLVGYFTALVLIIVLGMTALWWWQNHQQSNAERDTLVQNYKATENVSPTSPLIQMEPVSVKSTELNLPEQGTQTQLVEDSIQNSGAEENQKSAVENQPVSEVKGDLKIEITAASSWITVKDATRKNLAQQEYKQGEVLIFDGQGPYSLTIGAPANVKITYKGEIYPLTIDGRVARIKLQ
ncbi:MAG: helix-turn-helix domain-containing protein [Lonepinella koalarum]|nr:helix-turn-helix domain-containing protein [Lonepinella koalarum]